MKTKIIFPLMALLLLSGCSHVISEANRKLVDNSLSFSQLRENPDAAIGKYVMLGGMVASARNTKEGGRLEVVQFTLDDTGFPLETAFSGGRFLAESADFIDPLVYAPGRLVTIVGEVKGKKVLPLDEVDYNYPVITIREIYAWKTNDYDRVYRYPNPLPYYNFDPLYWDDFYPYIYTPPGAPFRRW